MKEGFPVIHSTLSGEALCAALRQKYDLSAAAECTLFRAAMNHLYIVSDGEDKFVFRVYTFGWRSKSEISEELRLLLHLKDREASVAFPIADNSAQLIQEFEAPEGTRFGVLFSYAKGTKTALFSPETSFSIGQALAKVHRSTENFKLDRTNYDTSSLIADSMIRTKRFFKEPSDEMRFLDELADFLHVKFGSVTEQLVRSGAVHLDVWFDNLHADDQNQVTFFDFDFCGNGWLCLDISYFLFQLFSTNHDENHYRVKANDFLRGYETEAEISDEERELLKYACLAIMIYYISIQCDRFEHWTNIFLNRDHLRRYVANLKRWIAYHGLEAEFAKG